MMPSPKSRRPRPKPELNLDRDAAFRSWEATITVDGYYGVVAHCSDSGSLEIKVFGSNMGLVVELLVDKRFLPALQEEA